MNFSCFLPYKRPFAVIVNVIVVEWYGSEIVYGILSGPDGDFFAATNCVRSVNIGRLLEEIKNGSYPFFSDIISYPYPQF